MRPLDILESAVASYAPYLQEDGELLDPVFGVPFQYGTAYYAYSNAILAMLGEQLPRSVYADRAYRGLTRALAHVANTSEPPTYSGVDNATGTLYRSCHRDFFWPAILQTYRILKGAGLCDITATARTLQRVNPEESFGSRPPSNWSAVWLSGEWLRMREELSAFPRDRFDEYLGVFFENDILLEEGFYLEPGLPNSYDLFTRYHLASIFCEGYDGPAHGELAILMETGLKRSLAVQLSDGSLASAHRSTGQTWTLGAQCAYFMLAANHYRDAQPGLHQAAERAAARAFASFVRWRRANGPYSPVENALPIGTRAGYQNYTCDANYGALAIGFLARAVELGLSAAVDAGEGDPPYARLIEQEPIHRALVHRDCYSAHVNVAPSEAYDTFGLADVTFGTGRFFHFATPVKHLESGARFGIGLALRREPGPGELLTLGQENFELIGGLQPGPHETALRITARPKGKAFMYELEVSATPEGVRVFEATPGYRCPKTLLIPYVRATGTGIETQVEMRQGEVLFTHGREVIAVSLGAAVERFIHLPHGYENRRGLCGMVRVDFREASEGIHYILARRA